MAWSGWYAIGEHFDDEGFSGTNVDRPGLFKLFRHIREGDVQRVVVYRLDRFTRKLTDWAELAGLLQQFNVGLTVVQGSVHADGGTLARLQMNVLATFAELERDMIADRLADARAARNARGERSAGRVPLGYTPDPRTKQLVVAETEAATVRWFFSRAAQGEAPRDLAVEANKLRLAGKGGVETSWSARTVLRVLRNRVYAGCRPDGTRGVHAAIIDPDQFERVQEATNGRRTRPSSTRTAFTPGHDPFILRGLLRCARCGKAMTTSMSTKLTRRTAKKSPRYYRCRTVGCRCQIGAAFAEQAALELLRHAIRQFPPSQREILEPLADAWDNLWPVNRHRTLQSAFDSISCTPHGGKLVATLHVEDAPPGGDPA